MATPAFADLGSTYGFGSSTAALVGSNRSVAYDGFAMDRSPSLMSFMDPVSTYGFLGAIDKFEQIKNVQTDTNFHGGSARTGDFDTDIPDTINFLFGTVMAIGKSERQHRVGVTFSSPIDKVTEPATKDPYQPAYSGYNADSQRMTLALGGSSRIVESLSFGFALNYYLIQGASYESKMPADSGSGRTTTGNIKMTVKPAIAPVLGTTWATNPKALTKDSGESTNLFTFYFTGARDHKLKMRDEILTVNGTTPVSFENEASLFYDPEVWSLGYAYRSPSWDITASLDRELWSRYDGGYLKYKFISFQGTFQQYPIDIKFEDIWIYRAGISRKWDDSALRFGVGFRPSPHKQLSKEDNFIDPDRWVGGLGYGFSSTIFGLMDDPIKFESHLQAHYLVPQDVQKESSGSLGAPGYKVGGWVYSYGLNMVVGL